MDNIILKKAEEYVLDILHKNTPENNVYHSVDHTKEVVKASQRIGKASELSDSDLEIVKLAAIFHDLGYVEKIEGHEEVSAKYAVEFLDKENYPSDKIEKVKGCILATKVPQKPKNILEQVICDSDLSHLGKKSFDERNNLFREEFEFHFGRELTEHEWLKKSIDFVSHHKFFTDYAKQELEPQKQKNLSKLRKDLEKLMTKNKNDNDEKGGKKKSKKDKKDIAGRGVETMFRNVIRTHVEFSSMADSKAHIMISVNTLVLTALIAFLLRKLDTNPHLQIPTAILTLVSLTTLIMAVSVTRPKVTSGTFTKEDILNKRANLLFFGNFYNMKLDDFMWGMKETISNKDYLYDSMIKDFYHLGQVIGQKYARLRICYNIFMYGLIVSIIAYAISIMLTPVPTNLGPLFE